MKNYKKLFHFFISPLFLGIVVTVAVTLLAYQYYDETSKVDRASTSVINRLISEIHEKTIDWRMRIRGEHLGSDRVAVLAIDEESIELEGRWPWPREKMAQLINSAMALGTKAIAFDIVFSEEDNSSSVPALSRLRHNLLIQGHLAPEVDSLVSQEIAKDNGDVSFSEAVARNPDHLILGAYSENPISNGAETSVIDNCRDGLFERSYANFYWRKESIPFVVNDSYLKKQNFPPQFKSNINDYVTVLEVKAATGWFDANQEKTKNIADQMLELGSPLPPESFPLIATQVINIQYDGVMDLLKQAKPELANREGVEKLFSLFKAAFTKKELAELTLAVRTQGDMYCARFFTDNDDLLNYENFKKYYSDNPELKPVFDALNWKEIWKAVGEHDADAKKEPFESALNRLRQEAYSNTVSDKGRWWLNIPKITNATENSGSFNTMLDSDGTVRRSPLLVRVGNNYMPSLALKIFLLDQGYKPVLDLGLRKATRYAPATKYIKALTVQNKKSEPVMTLPVDPEGNLMINYAGKAKMFPHVKASDILSDSPDMLISLRSFNKRLGRWEVVDEQKVNKKEFMKDKLLFLGVTATGVFDMRVSPFEENYPGVETHANILSNLLVENQKATGTKPASGSLGFLRTDVNEARYMWMFLLAFGLLLTVLLAHTGSVTGLGITILFLIGIFIIDNFVIFSRGVVITSFFPVTLVVADFVTLTFYKYFTEERTKRELKGTFEKYVSPSIVNEILKDPENLELGGKKMELTVLFSDVRGFTTISEKLDPRALSDLLNSYLTPMTNLVFANKGTLDKYMGDAIMAFWGAPLHFKDHAAHACRCALQMIERLKLLQAEYRSKGLPEIDIGIGLNTGEMSVGNMGSDTVRSYTVMGDAVNLGSRLEGINKQYGTRIIISEFTNEAVKSQFTTREIDSVRVKGKLQPVRIYELVSEGKPDATTVQVLTHFSTGLRLYHERKFAEAIAELTTALNLRPDDAPSQLYIERCQEYMLEPPPEDWDGVFTMTSK